MAPYTLDVISHHQRNIPFLLFACYFKDYIEYFRICSNSHPLARISSQSIHVNARVLPRPA